MFPDFIWEVQAVPSDIKISAQFQIRFENWEAKGGVDFRQSEKASEKITKSMKKCKIKNGSLSENKVLKAVVPKEQII